MLTPSSVRIGVKKLWPTCSKKPQQGSRTGCKRPELQVSTSALRSGCGVHVGYAKNETMVCLRECNAPWPTISSPQPSCALLVHMRVGMLRILRARRERSSVFAMKSMPKAWRLRAARSARRARRVRLRAQERCSLQRQEFVNCHRLTSCCLRELITIIG